MFSPSEIQSFLDSFPHKTQRRGRHYFRDNAVIEVACLESGRSYSAVVRGDEDYEVQLDYDPETRAWLGDCTCPVVEECKHVYAAMLALQANAARLMTPQTVPASKASRSNQPTSKIIPLVLRTEPQPPASPLCAALSQSLGRKLERAEADYVRAIQHLYAEVRAGYIFTIQNLRLLAPNVQGASWEELTLWPEFPRDDLQFWLYCAWELRKREVALPQLMVGVTDLSQIEPAMRAWQRRNVIESWRQRLAHVPVPTSCELETVDFRLMVLPLEARVQSRRAPADKFKDLKQAHLRRFRDAYETGSLAVAPEAMTIWLALQESYDGYSHSSCHFDYNEDDKTALLGRILRAPGMAERVVTSDELPLARSTKELRYQLRPAADESDDYVISLVAPDGSPAPQVVAVLPGYPALYLTERAVFPGPAPHPFGVFEPLRIPAPAIESAQGAEFLRNLKFELPHRIAERTRHIQVRVKLACEVKPTWLGSDTDAVYICVTAAGEGQQDEHCGSAGWQAVNRVPRFKSGETSASSARNGLITLVDRSAQHHFPARLEALGAKWEHERHRWRVRLSKSFPETFATWLESLPSEIAVELDPELSTLRDGVVSGQVNLNLEEAGVDWFDLKVVLNVSDLSLTQQELNLLLNARGRFVRLGKKGWRRLQFNLTQEEDERLARLGLNPRDFSAEPQRLHALQLADDAARKFLPEQTVERIQRRAAEIQTRVTPAVPEAITAELRPYQLSGFHFLAYLTANNFGGVLADDMGLGKTLQTLAWLAWLRLNHASRQAAQTNDSPIDAAINASSAHLPGSGTQDSTPGIPSPQPGTVHHPSSTIHHPPSTIHPPPSLVVCPKSVMDNWRSEAERFCSPLRVRLWQGEGADALESARAQADLIVLNYAQLRNLSPQISQYHWQVVVLDEAQYIKNPDSQTAQIARTLKADHRLALTGTPIENRLLDLWSIFAFVMPGVLGNRAHFARLHNQQDDPFARRRLASRVRPFLLRRTKSQVAQDLPDRTEEDLACEMEGEQQSLYRAELKRAQQLLLNVNTQKELNQQRFNFLTSLLRLRQICCHPALVSDQLRKADSAKLHAFLDLIEPLMDEGHKVLVFSQFVTMLDILRETVNERQWPHFYLAGDTENRGALVNQFQTAKGAATFLISLKAGGFGLNLTAANYVVLFDPWWNPAVEMQAIDRTHRIGQTSKVIAYRLLIKNSIEQKIRQLQQAKAALAQDILGEEAFSQSLSLDDFRFLLENQ
ncbi:MAG: hypothetical protein C5B50_21470 [Verrucomicrobia bacterium]|nr:MAG: hypothetical protein C5B50_21470 [Verrucomicrobiota bacterium]